MSQFIFLSDVTLHQKAKIVSFQNVTSRIKHKLIDMGLIKNTIVFIKKIAPLKDPVIVELRGYELALRKEEMKHIVVEVVK